MAFTPVIVGGKDRLGRPFSTSVFDEEGLARMLAAGHRIIQPFNQSQIAARNAALAAQPQNVPQVGTPEHANFMNQRNASLGLTQRLQAPVSPLTVQSSGSRPAAATTLSLPSTGQSGSSTGVLNALQGQQSPPNQVTFGGNPLTPTGGPLPNPANTTPAPAPPPTITPPPPVPNTPTATGATTVAAPPSNQFNGGQDLEDQGASLLNRGNELQSIANALRDISLRQSDNLSNLFDQQFQRQQGLVNNLLTSGGENSLLGAMQSQLGLLNSERGLRPEARAALRQQATADIPERFNRAAEAMRVELGRRGAIGGQMPGSTGDIVRGFAPLFAARERETAQATRDAILADEQQRLSSLLANRQIASNALGTGSNLLGQVANATSPNPLLQAALQSRGQSLDAAGLGNQAFGTQASLLNSIAQTDPNSFKNSLLSALAGGGISTGLGALDRWLEGLGDKAVEEVIDEIPSGDGSGTGTPGETSSGGGFGAAVGNFLKNPLTVGIGAALGLGALWMKSQARHEANEFVQKFQNPFANAQGTGILNRALSEYQKAWLSGGMTPGVARQFRSSIQEMVNHFERQRAEFGQNGGDKGTVARQAKETMDRLFGPGFRVILDQIDADIARLEGRGNA